MWIFRTSTRDSPLVSSGRDLDAPKRSRDVPNPKKRMLGVTPRVVFRASDPPNTPKRVSGDPQDICIYGRSERRQK